MTTDSAIDPQLDQRLEEIRNGAGSAVDFDDKVNKLVKAFGSEIDRYKASLPKDATGGDKVVTDKDLLGGPQLEKSAQSQEEIDALLASFN